MRVYLIAVVALISFLPAAVLAYQAQPAEVTPVEVQDFDTSRYMPEPPVSVEPVPVRTFEVPTVVITSRAPAPKKTLRYECDDWRKTKFFPGKVRSCEWR